MKLTGRDQRNVGKQRIVQRHIASEDRSLERLEVGLLQVHVPSGRVEVVLQRAIDRIRVAMDVHELRIGEHFQQQPNAGRVRRRLEDDRFVAVLEGELLREPQERRLPLLDLGPRHVAKRQIALVVYLAVRKADAEIERAETIEQQRELIFLRRLEAQGHVVHRPRAGEQKAKAAREVVFRRQERVRVDDLIGVGISKLRAILGDQIVQMRRPAPPMAEHEERRAHDRRREDLRTVSFLFAASKPGVEQADERDEERAVPIRRGDAEPILFQQPPPAAHGDAGQVVVRNAPAMLQFDAHETSACGIDCGLFCSIRLRINSI